MWCVRNISGAMLGECTILAIVVSLGEGFASFVVGYYPLPMEVGTFALAVRAQGCLRAGSPTRQYLPYVCNSVNKGCGAFWHEGPDVMSSVLWTMIIHLAVWGQRSCGRRRRMENDKDVVVQNGLRTWQSGLSVTSEDGVRQRRDIEGQHQSRLMGKARV